MVSPDFANRHAHSALLLCVSAFLMLLIIGCRGSGNDANAEGPAGAVGAERIRCQLVWKDRPFRSGDTAWGACYSSDGEVFASVAGNTVRVYRASDQRMVFSDEELEDGHYISVTFCGSSLIVAGSIDGDLRGWDVRTGELVFQGRLAEGAGYAICMAANREGKILAVGTHQGGVELWSTGPPRRLAAMPILEGSRVTAVAFTGAESEHLLALTGLRCRLHMWSIADLGKPSKLLDFKLSGGSYRGLAGVTDQEFVYCAGRYVVRAFVKDGTMVTDRLFKQGYGGFTAVAANKTAGLYAAAKAAYWDDEDKRIPESIVVGKLAGEPSAVARVVLPGRPSVGGIAWQPAGTHLLATCNEDGEDGNSIGTLRLFRVTTENRPN